MNAYLASNMGMGGLSCILLEGGDSELSQAISQLTQCNSNRIHNQLLSHCFIYNKAHEKIDEVVVATPQTGWRIITGHGGTATTKAILSLLEEFGFNVHNNISFQHDLLAGKSFFDAKNAIEAEADSILPHCQTELQAAIILTARQKLCGVIENITDQLENSPTDTVAYIEYIADLYAGYNIAQSYLTSKKIAILGAPNVGKSTLFNRLCGDDRAFVYDMPGTTRDAIRETIDIGGYSVELTDTAGLREIDCHIESAAHNKIAENIHSFDAALLVFDASRNLSADDEKALRIISQKAPKVPIILVLNKCDLPQKISNRELQLFIQDKPIIEISATGESPLESITDCLQSAFGEKWDKSPLPFTERQKLLLECALKNLPDNPAEAIHYLKQIIKQQ